MDRIFNTLRAWARRCPGYGWWRHRREVTKLQRQGYARLNFGCGPHPLPGWTNIDGGDGRRYTPPPHPEVVKLDVFEALALIPDGVADYITSEHFFEHFNRQAGHRLLRHWARILKPGGVLRIVTPDLDKEVRIYLDALPGVDWDRTVLPHRLRHIGSGNPDPYGKLLPGEPYTRSMLLNNGMHMDGHQYLYDLETLRQSMTLAGLAQVERRAFGQSPHDALNGIDRHDGGDSGRHWIPGIALVVEATR